MRQYLLRIICAAIACTLMGNMQDHKGAAGAVMKLITGVFLVFTMISPLASLKIQDMSPFTAGLEADAAYAAAIGKASQEESMAAIIKSETEAYILDKATSLNTPITAEVTLGDDLCPERVVLSGPVAPYAKFRLETILTEELGIAKENQIWTE